MSYGIRISDERNGVVSVSLLDILKEIQEGDKFYWSILFLDSIFNAGEAQSLPEKSLPKFESQIFESERGFFLNWTALNTLAKKFFQIRGITLLGCLNADFIKRYETDREMHEACDIVIEMFDYSYWEVYSKNKSLIEDLAKKCKDVEWLVKNE